MRFFISIVMCTAFALNGAGQYTYFNQVNGESGDDASEQMVGCEVVDEYIYTWGGGIFQGNQKKILRKYDMEGELLDETILEFPNAYVYSGVTNSFQRIPGEEAFLVSHAIVDDEGTHGFLMKIDTNLDTLWTKYLDIYSGATYIFTHSFDEDGFIIAGEYDEGNGGRGTFVAKLDLQGNYLWHQVLHEPSDGSFRNRVISPIPSGYVVSGASGGGENTEGRTEYLESSDLTLSTFETNEAAIRRGIMRHHLSSDGEIIVTQYIAYEDYPGSNNPSRAYSKLQLSQLNTDDLELELIGDYFDDYTWISGEVVKAIESTNESTVMSGVTYKEINDSLRFFSFAFKLDSLYNLEWYNEFLYDPCYGCFSRVYDIEQTSDGGYVMVGEFTDLAEDPYNKTWLVKIDACGDLQWQGCAPVGVGEWERSPSVSIFPNPTTDFLNVEYSTNIEVESIEIIDSAGRVVLNRQFRNRIDISNIGTGIYLLRILNNEGEIYSEKVIIE